MSEIQQGQVYRPDLGPATDYFDRNRAVTGRERLAHLDMLFRGAAPKSAIATCVPKARIVNISQIITVDKAELVEYAGKLSSAAADAVRDGLHLLFERM